MSTATLPLLTPGEMLRQEFLGPMGLTPYRLAKDIGVPLTRIVAILAGDRAVTPTRAFVWTGILAFPRAGGCVCKPTVIFEKRAVRSVLGSFERSGPGSRLRWREETCPGLPNPSELLPARGLKIVRSLLDNFAIQTRS